MKMTPKNEPKTRTHRPIDARIAELEEKIAAIRARDASKQARQLPEAKALVTAARSLDKAIAAVGDAGRQEMVRALESARAGLGEQLVVLGVRLADRKARRGGRRKKGEAA
jgi:hypothetical protein